MDWLTNSKISKSSHLEIQLNKNIVFIYVYLVWFPKSFSSLLGDHGVTAWWWSDFHTILYVYNTVYATQRAFFHWLPYWCCCAIIFAVTGRSASSDANSVILSLSVTNDTKVCWSSNDSNSSSGINGNKWSSNNSRELLLLSPSPPCFIGLFFTGYH